MNPKLQKFDYPKIFEMKRRAACGRGRDEESWRKKKEIKRQKVFMVKLFLMAKNGKYVTFRWQMRKRISGYSESRGFFQYWIVNVLIL